MSATPRDVATFMVELLRDGRGHLYQSTVASQVRQKFGEELLYKNANGNWALDKRILKAFNEMTGDGVVWERGSQLWRERREYDKPGRMQS